MNTLGVLIIPFLKVNILSALEWPWFFPTGTGIHLEAVLLSHSLGCLTFCKWGERKQLLVEVCFTPTFSHVWSCSPRADRDVKSRRWWGRWISVCLCDVGMRMSEGKGLRDLRFISLCTLFC